MEIREYQLINIDKIIVNPENPRHNPVMNLDVNNKLLDITKRIYTLCSRSIHGEFLPKEYTNYIKSKYKKVINELKKFID